MGLPSIRATFSVRHDGERVTVTFTRGVAQVLLRFPVAQDPEQQGQAGADLTVLIDNLEELVDAANLEIEAALLIQSDALTPEEQQGLRLASPEDQDGTEAENASE